jgi:hypothetical protein
VVPVLDLLEEGPPVGGGEVDHRAAGVLAVADPHGGQGGSVRAVSTQSLAGIEYELLRQAGV